MDPIAFSLGALEVRWYGILIALAFGLGTWLAYRKAAQIGLDPDQIITLILWILPGAIIGARLYYVIFNFADYLADPIQILAIWHGGLAIHGGIIGGIVGGAIYTHQKQLSFLQIADLLMPSLILGQAIGRWGNFFNQEAHGGAVSSAYIAHFPSFIQQQMLIKGIYYHPTFLYESLWCLAGFIFLQLLWAKRKFTGQVLAVYLIFYSLGRLFIEQLRTDSLMLGPCKAAQLISLLLIGLGIFIYYRGRKHDSFF